MSLSKNQIKFLRSKCHDLKPIVMLGQKGFRQKLARLEKIYHDIRPDLASLKGIDLNVADRVIVKLDRKVTYVKG